jgi:uncharacterized membrane protein
MEALLVIVGIIFFFLPIVAIMIAGSTQRELRQRMSTLEAESRELRVTIAELRQRIAEQDGTPRRAAPATSAPPRTAEVVPEPIMPVVPQPVTVEREEPEAVPTPEPVEAPQQTTIHAPSRPAPRPPRPPRPARAPKPARTREEWEDLVGGRLLNRIGAIALIIGVGFFLKYAFDREWITETMRAILGGALGFALLLIGYRSFRKGFKVFSQGLIGAGVAVLYLSVYAAFNFYHLGISQTSAFLMMMAVTVIAFQQAFQYDSVAVSLLGLIGGFLTPLLLSTGQANQVGLFTYIALLDAGILAIVAVRRSWGVLEPMALAGTWLIYTGWFFEYYDPGSRGTTVIFTSILWGLFFALDLYRAFSEGEPIPTISHAVAMTNAVAYYIALFVILDDHDGAMLTWVTVALGLAYFLPTLIRRDRQTSPFHAERSAVIGMILFAVAVAVAPFDSTDDHLRVLLWGAEALGFFWLGARWKFPPLWVTALILFAVDIVALVIYALIMSDAALPVVMLTRAELMECALALSIALTIIPARDIDVKVGSVLTASFQYLPALLVLVALTSITDRATLALLPAREPRVPGWTPEGLRALRADFVGGLARATVWLGYALLLIWTGLRRRWRPLLHAGLATIILAIGIGCVDALTYRPIQSYIPIINLRALVLLLFVAGCIVAARMLEGDRGRTKIAGQVAALLRIGIVLLVFELLTAETYDYFKAAIGAITDAHAVLGPLDTARIEYLGNMQQLAISGVWLLYSAILMVLGFMRRARSLRIISFALFGLSILKIFVYDLSFLDTLYRIFSFIGLGVILISISYLYTRYKEQIFGGPTRTQTPDGASDEAPEAHPVGSPE